MSKLADLRQKITGYLRGDSLGQQAARGSVWLMSGRISVQVSQLVRIAIVARFVGPTEFGIMAIALLILQVLEAFTNPGLDQALIQSKEDISPLLNSVFWFKVVRGLFLYAIVIAASEYIATFFRISESVEVIRAAALILVIRGFQSPAIAYVHRHLRFKPQFMLDISSTLSGFVTAMALLLVNDSVWVLVISLLVEEMTRTFGSYLIQPWAPKLYFSWERIQTIGKFGRWVTIGTMVTYVSLQLDSIVIGRLLDASSLGIYQMAMRVSQLPATQIGHVGGTIAFPILSKVHGDERRFRHTYLRIMGILFLVSITITMTVVVFAQPIVTIAFGDQWVEAIPIMRVLAIAGFIRGMLTTAGRVFYSIGKPEYDVYLNAGRMVVMLVLIFPMVTHYGIIGGAWTFTSSLVAIIPVYLFFIKRGANLSFRDHLSIFARNRAN